MELVRDAGLGQIEQVRVSGGGARSALWRQILADVLDTELVTVNTTEGAAYGAALLAGVGVGVWPDVDTACDDTVHVVDRVGPNPGRVDQYEGFYEIYSGLYATLKRAFHELTSLVV
jgi:xylulokinase